VEAHLGAVEAHPEPWRLTLEPMSLTLNPWRLTLEPPWNQGCSPLSHGAHPGAVVAPPGEKEVILEPQSSSWSWEAQTGAVEAHLERSRLTLEPWSFPWSHGASPGALPDSVPNKETGSCLDPKLHGTGLQKEGGEGPSPFYSREKSQLEPSRDGENMRRDREEPIPDLMKEDQRPTE
jgi:hypothetical protein